MRVRFNDKGMASVGLLLAITFVPALCASLAADESDPFDMVCEFPENNAVYTQTSDIIVTGRCKFLDGTVVVGQHYMTMLTWTNELFNVSLDGNWSWRLPVPLHGLLPPGQYRLLFHPVRGPRIAVPITIVRDAAGSDVPPALPATTIDSEEFEKLPKMTFPEVTLSNSDESLPEIVDRGKEDAPEIPIDSEFEFAVEGSFRVQEPRNVSPSDIVLRLSGFPVGVEGKEGPQKASLCESICRWQPSDDDRLFRYRDVIRAPKRVGKLTLEAIYRKKIISTATVDVRPSTKSPPGFDWVIENPPADARYAPASRIVIAGKCSHFGEAIGVSFRDSGNIVSSVGQSATGQREDDGAWSCALAFAGRSAWRPGNGEIIVRPLRAAEKTLRIKIIATPDDSRVARQEATKPGSDEFDALPKLDVGDVTISRSDVVPPAAIAEKRSADPAIKIEVDQEFAVHGSFILNDLGEFTPSQAILRLRRTADRDGKPGDAQVTMDEALADYDISAQGRGVPFQAVLRAPSRTGVYMLETIYRRAVLAKTTVTVIAADANAPQVVCTYPSKDAVYSSTSDIAVTGRATVFGLKCSISIRDGENVVQQSGLCSTGLSEEDGKWSCGLSMPHGVLPPGPYTLDVVPARGPRTSIPISVVADSSAPSERWPPSRPKVDTAEYNDLRRFKFADITVPNPGAKAAALRDSSKVDDDLTIEAEGEFAVECILRVPTGSKHSPLDLVFRMRDTPALGAGQEKHQRPTVREEFGRTEPLDDDPGFRCRSVLQAPNRTGKFTLEAVYGNQVVAASQVDVTPSQKTPKAKWVVEFPPPASVYMPPSEIVVTGRSIFPANVAIVELLDAQEVVQSIAAPTTGAQYEDGKWACRLRLPAGGDWRPGDYQIVVRPIPGGQIKIPVRLIGEADQSLTIPQSQTMIGTANYDALPRLEVPHVTLATADGDNPEIIAREKTRDGAFKVAADAEFAIQGSLIFRDEGEFHPFHVVVRVRKNIQSDGQKPGDSKVTVGETVAKYDDLAQEQRTYPFRAILRAPHQAGTYTVETIYRRGVVASSPL